MVINHHALLLFIRISQLQYARDGRKDLGGSIAEELDTHKRKRIEDYRIKDVTFSESLMEKNGYLESCHQLNPNNGIKQLENQQNPCLLDILLREML